MGVGYYCSSCESLDHKKEKKGKVDGCMYLCKMKTKEAKKDVYVNPTDKKCDKYKKTWDRDKWDNNELYAKGEKWDDNDTPSSTYLIILVLIIVFAIIFNLF